jgi:hypothetical protein
MIDGGAVVTLGRRRAGIALAEERLWFRQQEAIMDWDDLLPLVTLGAVLPYLAAATVECIRQRVSKHDSGAGAPS